MQGWVGPCGVLPPARTTASPPPALPLQHQQQVLQAVERAKQVTMGELNTIVGVSGPAWPWAKSLSCLGVRALQ